MRGCAVFQFYFRINLRDIHEQKVFTIDFGNVRLSWKLFVHVYLWGGFWNRTTIPIGIWSWLDLLQVNPVVTIGEGIYAGRCNLRKGSYSDIVINKHSLSLSFSTYTWWSSYFLFHWYMWADLLIFLQPKMVGIKFFHLVFD